MITHPQSHRRARHQVHPRRVHQVPRPQAHHRIHHRAQYLYRIHRRPTLRKRNVLRVLPMRTQVKIQNRNQKQQMGKMENRRT